MVLVYIYQFSQNKVIIYWIISKSVHSYLIIKINIKIEENGIQFDDKRGENWK